MLMIISFFIPILAIYENRNNKRERKKLFIFDLVFVLAPIFVIGMFVFVFCMVLSPKLRSKFMGHQLKMQKQMLFQKFAE